MPNSIRNIQTQFVDVEESLIVDIDVDIPLHGDGGPGLARCNVYRPMATKDGAQFPIIMTMGPYGKDIPYAEFHPQSFSEVSADQKSKYSAWETPEPTFWCKHGYVVVRVDERGYGQSPGYADSMSKSTSGDFACCIEWAAQQPWSTGKVGLLGVSYFGGTQWRVAARRPKGLACIIPWEGMSDYYRDRCRHGGILCNKFIDFWYNRQVGTNQYGLAGRNARKWGPDTIEGDLSAAELASNRADQTIDNAKYQYLDEPYYASRDYDIDDIDVPILSVANWGGILLHLRGNVVGYLQAGTTNKWLWFITGRHDLPFYLPEYTALQKSFLDAWLKDDDDRGWKLGPNVKVPAINMAIRAGAPRFNTLEGERSFSFRAEAEWPLSRTRYRRYHLHSDLSLRPEQGQVSASKLEYQALDGPPLLFSTPSFIKKTEITGHVVAKLTLGVSGPRPPQDLDVFVTIRHYNANDEEIYYTGTVGDAVPVTKGWLRASMRKVNAADNRHREWLPFRAYASADRALLDPDTPYEMVIEVWPTNVVVGAGNKLVFEVSPKDTQGSGIFGHDHPQDRSLDVFAGLNVLHFGAHYDNWVSLPVIE